VLEVTHVSRRKVFLLGNGISMSCTTDRKFARGLSAVDGNELLKELQGLTPKLLNLTNARGLTKDPDVLRAIRASDFAKRSALVGLCKKASEMNKLQCPNQTRQVNCCT